MRKEEMRAEGYSYVNNFEKRMTESSAEYQERCRQESWAVPMYLPPTHPMVTRVIKPECTVQRIIAMKPLSNHPEDYYLSVVIVELDTQYAVWTENSQDTARVGCPAYNSGHYFPKTAYGLGQALQKFDDTSHIHVDKGDL